MDLNEGVFAEAGVRQIMARLHGMLESLEHEYPGLDFLISVALPVNGAEKVEGPVVTGHLHCTNVPGAHMLAAAIMEMSRLRCQHHGISGKLMAEMERAGKKQAVVAHEGLKTVEKPNV